MRIDKDKERIWLLVTPRKDAKQRAVGAVEGPLSHTFAEIAMEWFKRGYSEGREEVTS